VSFFPTVVQFGYVTLFVVAFPLAPLAALVNNVFETRVDSFKLLKLTRRPEPRGAYNIGIYLSSPLFVAICIPLIMRSCAMCSPCRYLV
jgi:anoctamin-10/anoctamin-7